MQRADSDIIASSQSIYSVYSFKGDTKVTKAALLQFCHMCCTIIPGSRRKSAFAGPQGLVGSAAVFDWPPISSEPAHPVPWSAANIHTHSNISTWHSFTKLSAAFSGTTEYASESHSFHAHYKYTMYIVLLYV